MYHVEHAQRECACGCGVSFTPRNSLQKVAGLDCAIRMAKARQTRRAERELEKTIRTHRKELLEAKRRIKTRSEWMREAQAAFNAFIRARDADKPCICCGRPLGEGAIGGGYDCGHYRSVGSAPHLRFDERNAHGQRKQCNRWGSGRAVDYRIGLIQRIGHQAVEALEDDQSEKHYSIDDLKAIKAEYKAKLKELRNGNKAIP